MLYFSAGRMFYSDRVSWALVGSTALIAAVGAVATLCPQLFDWPPLLLSAIDRGVAFFLLHPMIIEFVRSKVAAALPLAEPRLRLRGAARSPPTPCALLRIDAYDPVCVRANLSGDVASSRALRTATALAISACLVEIVIAALGRRLLLLVVALVAASIVHGLSWVGELSMCLQRGGLLCLLPERLVRTVLTTSILDILTTGRREIEHLTEHPERLSRDQQASLVVRARALAPLLLVPREDQAAALALLPPDLRHAVEMPLVESLLPGAVQEMMHPWANGSDRLRLRRTAGGAPGGSTDERAAAATGSNAGVHDDDAGNTYRAVGGASGALSATTTSASPVVGSSTGSAPSDDTLSGSDPDEAHPASSLPHRRDRLWSHCFAPEQLLLRVARRTLLRRLRRAVYRRLRRAIAGFDRATGTCLSSTLVRVESATSRATHGAHAAAAAGGDFASGCSAALSARLQRAISFKCTLSGGRHLTALLDRAPTLGPLVAGLASPVSVRASGIAASFSGRAAATTSAARGCATYLVGCVVGTFALFAAIIIVLVSRAAELVCVVASVLLTLAARGVRGPMSDEPAATTEAEGATSSTTGAGPTFAPQEVPLKTEPVGRVGLLSRVVRWRFRE